jgi:hypothetical protein
LAQQIDHNHDYVRNAGDPSATNSYAYAAPGLQALVQEGAELPAQLFNRVERCRGSTADKLEPLEVLGP